MIDVNHSVAARARRQGQSGAAAARLPIRWQPLARAPVVTDTAEAGE